MLFALLLTHMVLEGRCSSPWPWQSPSVEAETLQASITAAISEGAAVFRIPAGTYTFNSANLNVSNAFGFTLLAETVDLVFTPGYGVVVRDCSNITVLGPLWVDHGSPAYSQGTITSLGSTCFSTSSPPNYCDLDITLHADFPPPTVWCTDCETKLIFFDSTTGLMRRPQIVAWLSDATETGHGSFRLRTLQLWEHSIKVGDVVAIASRVCPCTYQILNSTHVVTQDVAVFSSCNMAFYELGGLGGNVYNRVNVTTKPPRLLASNFDGLHSEGTLVGPIITASQFEHIGDDFFNVQNAIDIVLGWADRATIIVADASFGSTFPVAPRSLFRFFLPVVGNSWKADEVFNASVCSTQLLSGAAEALWRPRVSNISAVFLDRYGWSLDSFVSQSFSLYALTLCPDTATPPSSVDYTSLAQVNSSFGAVLRGNVFSDGLGRVGPLNSPFSICEGNIFNGTMYGGILVSAEITWLSGNLGIQSVIIHNNTFVDCCSYARLGFTGGQCNVSSSAPFPVFNPGGSMGLIVDNNTVL